MTKLPDFKRLSLPIDRGRRQSYPPDIENPYPWNKLSKDKPSDWGWDVTVCIAAICEGGKSLITAADSMLSTVDISGDKMALKFVLDFHGFWTPMYAADDTSFVTPICQSARGKVDFEKVLPLNEITSALSDSYQQIRRKAIENQLLGSYGITINDLVSPDTVHLPDQVESALHYEMNKFDLGCEFLVSGFDEEKRPHIFSVQNPGIISHFDEVGFWAIGSGQRPALSSLFFHLFNRESSLELAVYRIYEAKLMAESALGVGKDTTLLVHRADSWGDVILHERDLVPLRKLWNAKGKPRLPESAEEKTDEIIKKMQEREKKRKKEEESKATTSSDSSSEPSPNEP